MFFEPNGQGGTVFLSETTIFGNTNNGYAFGPPGATIQSFGNNFIANNSTNTGTLVPISPQ